MSELEGQRELKGFGGWLVLFQIYIIIMVVGGVQTLFSSLFYALFMGAAMAGPPYHIILQAVEFVLALVCMVLFYRRRKAFRPMFVVHSIFFLGISISNRIELGTGFDIISIVGLVLGNGVAVAFMIALYKSQRVKNTFVK